MRRAEWWLEWPDGVVRTGVLFLALVSVIAVAVRYAGLLDELGDDAARNSALSFADRDIAGGNGIVVDQAAVYAARAIIPADETFRVFVDPAFAAGTELTVPYVGSYYRYYLMPRRYADDAPWIVCYSCDLAVLGTPVDVVWRGSDDISIARVRS